MPVSLINNLVKLHAEPRQGSATGTTGAGPNLQRVGQADEDPHLSRPSKCRGLRLEPRALLPCPQVFPSDHRAPGEAP